MAVRYVDAEGTNSKVTRGCIRRSRKNNMVILSPRWDVSDTKPACNGSHEAPI